MVLNATLAIFQLYHGGQFYWQTESHNVASNTLRMSRSFILPRSPFNDFRCQIKLFVEKCEIQVYVLHAIVAEILKQKIKSETISLEISYSWS